VTPQPAAPLLPRHNRILGRVTRTVTKPWHLYPVGLLFGLGFDTVTEVGLLVIAGGAPRRACRGGPC